MALLRIYMRKPPNQQNNLRSERVRIHPLNLAITDSSDGQPTSHKILSYTPQEEVDQRAAQRQMKDICLAITLTTLLAPVREGRRSFQPIVHIHFSQTSYRLNAIMLGRLRMRVEECLDRYPEMAHSVFSGQKRSTFTRLVTMTSTKYDNTRLEEEIKKIVNHKTPQNGTPLKPEFAFDKYHSPQDLCKT
jgi:hypothetical protein